MLQALSEKHNSFLKLLKKKGFKEEIVTTIRLYDIGKYHDPGIQQEPGWFELQSLQEGEKTLQGAHQLQAYDLSPEGQVSNRRVLIDYAKQDKPCRGPDGMVADTEGNIWLASRCEWRPGIQVLSPTGKELAYISTGKELPTNVGFGRDADANLLSLTSGKSLCKMRVGKKGYQLP